MDFVLEKDTKHISSYPLETRLLMDGILRIDQEINRETANSLINKLLYLKSTRTDKKITIFINSPGGSVYDGLGIYDMMQLLVKEGFEITTINCGMAASMAAILLMSGTKRISMPHSRTMLHEVSSLSYGKTSSMKDDMKEMETLQNILNDLIKRHADERLISICDRKDFWMSAEEAKEYKMIDEIKQIY